MPTTDVLAAAGTAGEGPTDRGPVPTRKRGLFFIKTMLRSVDPTRELLMDSSTQSRTQAERHFRPNNNRPEKGTAMETIAAQHAATQDKTARLRALRLAREATIVVAPEKKRRAVRTKGAA